MDMEPLESQRRDGGLDGQEEEEKRVEAHLQEADAGADILVEIRTPEWLEIIFDVTRITELKYAIQEEREQRSKETYQNPYQQVFQLVTSLKFEAVVAIVVILNCLVLGVEASVQNGDGMEVFDGLEHFFVAFFLIEWLLRVRAFGWSWVFEPSNAADTFFVFCTGVFPKWILEPVGWNLGNLRIFLCLRALRLVRIVRAVRLMPQFRELWMLIQGLMQSLRPLLWTSVIAIMIIYIFGVAATELFGRSAIFEDDEKAQELLGNPLRAMFTMFQLMTMDAWAEDVVRPLMEKQWNICLFFVFYMFIAVFVFWNLITAVIVENAMAISREDVNQRAKGAEEVKKQELKMLADLFLEINQDGSGELTSAEFFGALKNKKVKQMLDLLELKIEEMENVWKVLDEGQGILTIKEFTTGLRRMKGEAKAKDIVDLVKKLRRTSLHHTEITSQVEQLSDTLSGLEKDVSRIQNDTGEVLGLFQEMYHRLEAHILKEESRDRMLAVKRDNQRVLAELQDDLVDKREDLDGEDAG